jgi:hypothetical protein
LYAAVVALADLRRGEITEAAAVDFIRKALAQFDAAPVYEVREIEGLPPLYS